MGAQRPRFPGGGRQPGPCVRCHPDGRRLECLCACDTPARPVPNKPGVLVPSSLSRVRVVLRLVGEARGRAVGGVAVVGTSGAWHTVASCVPTGSSCALPAPGLTAAGSAVAVQVPVRSSRPASPGTFRSAPCSRGSTEAGREPPSRLLRRAAPRSRGLSTWGRVGQGHGGDGAGGHVSIPRWTLTPFSSTDGAPGCWGGPGELGTCRSPSRDIGA